MNLFVEAVKSNDLVKAKKAFGPIMQERTLALIEARKKYIASKVMLEAEESEEDEDNDEPAKSDGDDADKSEKDKSIDSSAENNKKSIDSKKTDDNKRDA